MAFKNVILAGLINAAFAIVLIMIANTPSSFLRGFVIASVLYLYAFLTHVMVFSSKDGLLRESDLEENTNYSVVAKLPFRGDSASRTDITHYQLYDTVVLVRITGTDKIFAVVMNLEGRELPWMFRKIVTKTKVTDTKIEYLSYDGERQ